MKKQNKAPWKINTILTTQFKNIYSNKKICFNEQLTPPSLDGPIQKKLYCINMMKLVKTTEHGSKQ